MLLFKKSYFIAKKKVIIKGNANNSLNEQRNHIAAAANNSKKDDNIDDRIAKFNAANALSTVKTYRIPLRYLVDLGLVNLPTAFDTKFIFHFEQKLNKLFESKAKLANKTKVKQLIYQLLIQTLTYTSTRLLTFNMKYLI